MGGVRDMNQMGYRRLMGMMGAIATISQPLAVQAGVI
jgi:hypothetical protein